MAAVEATKIAEKEFRAEGTPTYNDLREWLEIVESFGQLKRIDGVDWNLEMGTLSELIAQGSKGPVPAVLYDKIKGYPEGFRVLFAQNASFKRMALALGLPLDFTDLDLVRATRTKISQHNPIPHRVVDTGPVMENVLKGDDINLLKFPVPFIHELDGGRYIGTGCLVVTKDPDEGWVNFGTYRGMVQDEKSMNVYISPGKHGRIQRDKWFDRGEKCPVIVCVGQDPVLFMVSGNEVDYGVSEYDYAGGLKGHPIDVINGEVTGLPFPAHAEIVIEGFMDPDERKTEGPFGEWTGYYASNSRPEPLIRVQRIYHRNNPILTAARPGRPPSDYSLAKCMVKAALIWIRWRRPGCPTSRASGATRPAAAVCSTSSPSSSAIRVTRARPVWWPRRCTPGPISDVTSSWWTTISIPPRPSTCSGRWPRVPIPWTPSTSCAAAGADPSTRASSRARRASTPAPSSTPPGPSSG